MSTKILHFNHFRLLIAICIILQTSCTKEVSNTNSIKQASLTTAAVINITQFTASSGGDITSDGGSSVTTRGACWSIHDNPTLSDSFTIDGSGIGSFTSNIANLIIGTKYFVRSYATNKVGTSYGNSLSFNTNPSDPKLPTVATYLVSSVTDNAAIGGGYIANNNGTSVFSRGVCWSTTQNPTLNNSFTNDGGGSGAFTSNLFGLNHNILYYVRAYATNNVGTAYGNSVSFTTTNSKDYRLPKVSTNYISSIIVNGAFGGGAVTDSGGAGVLTRGVCWSTNVDPYLNDPHTIDGSGMGSFTSNLVGLTIDTKYYVRAYATNKFGTYFGDAINLTMFLDIDGNMYHTVSIGYQIWMGENLKTTRYRNGDPIPNVTDSAKWRSLQTGASGAYCNYNNDTTVANTYGRLYNWYAINDSRSVAPIGWHVATRADWDILGYGAALKEKGTSHWLPPNTGANDYVGFTALPGGERFDNFGDLGTRGRWWTSTDENTSGAYLKLLVNDGIPSFSFEGLGKYSGLSVRCVKD